MTEAYQMVTKGSTEIPRRMTFTVKVVPMEHEMCEGSMRATQPQSKWIQHVMEQQQQTHAAFAMFYPACLITKTNSVNHRLWHGAFYPEFHIRNSGSAVAKPQDLFCLFLCFTF